MAEIRLCCIEGCGKLHMARGWCGAHYEAWRIHGDPLVAKPRVSRAKISICSQPDCGKPVKCKGLCAPHYQLQRVYGRLETVRFSAGQMQEWLTSHVDYAEDDCLPWPFGRLNNGYGRYSEPGGEAGVASRVMCIRAHGEPPTLDHEAAHSCGRGHEGCVNPRHLRWATSIENKADQVDHGTVRRGETYEHAKLTIQDVRQIRKMQGVQTAQELADRFNVHPTHIQSIQAGRAWKRSN